MIKYPEEIRMDYINRQLVLANGSTITFTGGNTPFQGSTCEYVWMPIDDIEELSDLVNWMPEEAKNE